MAIRSYRDLMVWQKSIDLVVESYRVSKALPKTETYGLVTQMQRAAVSVPANIAEGQGRKHLAEYLHHLSIARGSLLELETHLIISLRLGYVRETDIEDALKMSDEVSRMISGLSSKLRAARTSPLAAQTS
jgi:four helix bundle protein